MKRKKNKAFTLIELLVVISLMGLLSFIVLASMDSAREKGRESQMQSQFASLRAQAERYYSKYNTFGDNGSGWYLCSDKSDGFGSGYGPGLLKDIADTVSVSGGITRVGDGDIGAWNQVTCHSSNDKWVVEAPLSTSIPAISQMLCVDSTMGAAKPLPLNLKAYSFSCADQDRE